jgi:hypothetical protein
MSLANWSVEFKPSRNSKRLFSELVEKESSGAASRRNSHLRWSRAGFARVVRRDFVAGIFDEIPFRVWLTGMKHRVRLQFTILATLLGLAAASCSKPKPLVSSAQPSPAPPSASQPSATPSSSGTDAGGDACTLLTTEEIQAVQGEAFKNTKPTEKTSAGLSVAQCYFELPTASNSVVLTVTRPAPGGRSPAENWKEIFHREKASEKKEEGEEKEPLKVEGIGDEAFWTGNRVGGALYVLKGNSYIRISVGGAGDQTQKVAKSKTLAESVLKRL